ncbi:substrate-binding domain-containing protein [Alicyclobacillus mali]|uniref:Substrate-binding domain-containing protein n=1 Tax=Alicyclobacillus mali (ex Roth et al. 2021) TaxID=1123961 RepID=A0ABS0F294_9BACL|nr:substrate-binding domain-containing protein [Alicyclobacillus mali (ex Roth et al. 2021)]MBF8377371.1 substrate-binding domain-containing protein [Alicyclobacillus mali (ex Roth et al. 2021)]MCL6487663.1 substrate-binding domain-containing protein [Alicyclobacillus mali (ex Roth et al. 2021)]
MTTMADVAKRAGVSIMTVSRVVNNSGYVKPSTRQKVLAAMQELNYVPKSQQSSPHDTWMLIVPDITNPFFTFIARGMEDVARKHGFRVFIANTDEDLDKELEYVQMCLEYQVRGALVVPVGDPSRENLMRLTEHHVPFVLIDREIDGLDADLVKGDIRETSRRLVDHLLELGHHRIAAVVGPLHSASSRERLDGYRDALLRRGLPVDESLIFTAPMTRDMDAAFIDELARRADAPSALFLSNMFQYAHIVRRLRALGLSIPEDISVVSFGNTDDLASVDSLATAAVQPAYNYGSLGAQLLLERIEGVRRTATRIVLNSEIVVRRSTAPPRVRAIQEG